MFALSTQHAGWPGLGQKFVVHHLAHAAPARTLSVTSPGELQDAIALVRGILLDAAS